MMRPSRKLRFRSGRVWRHTKRFHWLAAFAIAGCTSAYETASSQDAAPEQGTHDDAGASDAGGKGGPDGSAIDASSLGDAGANGGNGDASTDSGVDAGPQIPFASYLVLRLETDAPNGLQGNGAWRDLSPKNQTITLAGGTPTVQSSGDAGAKGMTFSASGLYFDVADSPDLRFGATDDFVIVARATIAVPLESGSSGCAFHYLYSKYFTDNVTGPHMRVCAYNPVPQLAGSLKLTSADTTVDYPLKMQTSYDVVSFARNMSGLRIETYAGGVSNETTLNATVDPSSTGSPFVLGGARQNGTGALFGSYIGNVNRLYVYHAPGGTFSVGDIANMRAYVKAAAPLP
jgi:hypothetical protein